jgi:hypothetical protein
MYQFPLPGNQVHLSDFPDPFDEFLFWAMTAFISRFSNCFLSLLFSSANP